MLKLRALLAAAFCLISGVAHAAFLPAAPVQVPSAAAISGGKWIGTQSIYIAGYYTPNDGGQGIFNLGQGGSQPATGCTADGGYIIATSDTTPLCFYRTNLNGDMAQWGITKGSVYDWNTNHSSATDASPILTAAQTVLATQGIYTIHTRGVTIRLATNYSLASGMGFSCDGLVSTNANTDYTAQPASVVEEHGVTFDRAGNGTSVSSCLFRPSWYTTKPATVQAQYQLLANMVSNNDTGLACDHTTCNDHDLMILGFDTCYEAQNAPNGVVDNLFLDCNVGAWVDSTGGNLRWSKIQVFPFLTAALTNNEEAYTVTSISNNGGLCHLTVTPEGTAVLTDLQYPPYVNITDLTSTSSGCEGRWTITNLDTGAGTFDLVGSAVLGPTTFGNWASGTRVIYVANGTNIANGEVINGLDAQGIPSGTTVSTAWPFPPQTQGYLTDTGSAANTYVAIAPSATQPCKLLDGLEVAFTAAHANTGASTLNITLNSAIGCTGGTTGPIALDRLDETALQENDIVSGANYIAHYNGTTLHWELKQFKVVLSAPTTLAQSAPVSMTFTNAVCSPCGSAPEAWILSSRRVDAGASAGGVAAGGTGYATGYLIGGPIPSGLPNSDNVAGWQCDQCFAFDHSFEAHIQNSQETGFIQFGSDSHGFTDDPLQWLVYVDGHSNNVHIGQRKAGKAGVSVVVNAISPGNVDKGCVTWNDAAVASTTGFFPVFDVENGCLLAHGAISGGVGSNLIGHFASWARFDVYLNNVMMQPEDSLAQSIINTDGSILAGGYSNPMSVQNVGPTVTTNTSITGTAVVWPCDATSGAVTLTLPSAASYVNQRFVVEKIDSSANACIVATAGSDTILGGFTSYYLYTQGQGIGVTSGGTKLWQ